MRIGGSVISAGAGAGVGASASGSRAGAGSGTGLIEGAGATAGTGAGALAGTGARAGTGMGASASAGGVQSQHAIGGIGLGGSALTPESHGHLLNMHTLLMQRVFNLFCQGHAGSNTAQESKYGNSMLDIRSD